MPLDGAGLHHIDAQADLRACLPLPQHQMEPAEAGGGAQAAKEPPGERLRGALCDLELQNTGA